MGAGMFEVVLEVVTAVEELAAVITPEVVFDRRVSAVVEESFFRGVRLIAEVAAVG